MHNWPQMKEMKRKRKKREKKKLIGCIASFFTLRPVEGLGGGGRDGTRRPVETC